MTLFVPILETGDPSIFLDYIPLFKPRSQELWLLFWQIQITSMIIQIFLHDPVWLIATCSWICRLNIFQRYWLGRILLEGISSSDEERRSLFTGGVGTTIHFMRWLTNFYDFRVKWTATAIIGIHFTKAWLSQLVNFKNTIWTSWHLRRTICNKILF